MQRLARFLAERHEVDDGRIAVRGSSMGGLLAIHVAADSAAVAAVVAICPAAEWMLLEDVQRVARRASRRRRAARSTRCGSTRAALVAWLEEHDVRRRRRAARARSR